MKKTIPINHPYDLVNVFKIGSELPAPIMAAKHRHPGAVGHMIEKYVSFQTGIPLRKSGPDMKINGHYCEIKTRQQGCQSAVQFGTTNINEICTKSFEHTGLYNQLEYLFYVWYNHKGIITHTGVYDLTEYRDLVNELFQETKHQLLLDDDIKYVSIDGPMYLEKTGSSVFQLRSTERNMRKIQRAQEGLEVFNDFFDIA